MGKLNIAHHKSYHPYRRDNIERVRRDEEEARQREAVEEGRMMLADSEARMDLLRHRAGLQGPKSRKDKDKDKDDVDAQIARAKEKAEADDDDAQAAPGPSTLTSKTGHINFFEDLEQQGMAAMAIPVRSTKRAPPPASGETERETDRGVALAPSAKDLHPWYSDRTRDRGTGAEPEGEDMDKRRRDLARKSVHDPLTAINTQLASRDVRPSGSKMPPRPRAPPAGSRPVPAPASAPSRGGGGGGDGGSGAANANPTSERTSRESAERLRALELIRRRKREAGSEGGETPSTVRGGRSASGDHGYGYGDVFNRREVEEAHREKARRGWRDNDRDRDGDRDRNRDRDRNWDRDGRDGGRERDRDRRGGRGRW